MWSVTVNASIPEAERAVHQSAPLDWLDFPAIQQVFCPNSDQVAVGTSLQRITQMPWVRWDGAKSVAAAPGEVNASRYMASTEGCSVSLIEKQGKVHLEVMLVYSLMGIRIDDLHPSQPL